MQNRETKPFSNRVYFIVSFFMLSTFAPWSAQYVHLLLFTIHGNKYNLLTTSEVHDRISDLGMMRR